ncbi:glutathione hydrolase 1 proenzyme isoform X3 [Leptinotarsa decemlineata]|uniref:glutathione hydrolase 1 proenzyme isoform X2 n=1 Tax=Leptinotarsa decemlineata TaxID=7539 RepID=UPI003D308475
MTVQESPETAFINRLDSSSNLRRARSKKKNKLKRNVIGALVFLALIIVVVVLVVIFTKRKEQFKGSVVTSGHGCSDIGISIMKKGGNAVDAAIAALFCEGVAMPECMGLGGGFLLTLYNKSTGEVWALNAREAAPAAATETMFVGQPAEASLRGGRSVAVPGELRGYWHLYQRFGGGLPWRDLVQPTIDLCRNGIYVTKVLASRFKMRKALLYKDPVLREIFFNPETNDTYLEGQYYKRLKLARTLETIAKEGGDALNNGSLTRDFITDIKNKGGIMTEEDMRSYRPQWQEPVQAALTNNHTLYASPLPGSGVILAFILNILSNFINLKEPNSITTNQRIVESFKFGYGKRTEFGDPDFVDFSALLANLTSKEYAERIRRFIHDNSTSQNPQYYGANTDFQEDHGTSHISVLSPEGDAVSVTSTINFIFGAGFASNSTGIILNDDMDDFSSPNMTNGFGLPASPANYIAPGKRPMSSMCPTIVLDENKNVIMVPGGSGGTKITTAVALTVIKHLWFGMDLKSAINEMRLHHQLFPMKIIFESGYKKKGMDIVDGLHKIGHEYDYKDDYGFAAVAAIAKNPSTGEIVGVCDDRRPGSVAYIN